MSDGDRLDANRWLEAVWRRERRMVAAVLLAHMPVSAELDDLLQDVALALVRSGLRPGDPGLRAWLRTVARNTAIGAGRRHTARERHLNVVAADLDSISNPGGKTAQPRAALGRVLRLVGQLPEHYREPLLLRCVQGYSQARIAEVLGIPEATVETRLARARKRLREVDQRAGKGDRR